MMQQPLLQVFEPPQSAEVVHLPRLQHSPLLFMLFGPQQAALRMRPRCGGPEVFVAHCSPAVQQSSPPQTVVPAPQQSAAWSSFARRPHVSPELQQAPIGVVNPLSPPHPTGQQSVPDRWQSVWQPS